MDSVSDSNDMDDIVGKHFPICQGALSPDNGKELPMAPNKALPRQTLAKNLKALIEKSGLSAPEVARLAKVDRKTVNNQLNGRYDPRPEQVDAVASVFGLRGWLLLLPSFKPEMAAKAQEILDLFGDANEDGRDNILRVAQMEARYKR